MENLIKKGSRSAKIAVIMAVYNSELYLKEAVESILSQSYPDFEFIIVDDGSTDSSLEILKSYDDQRITIINQKNAGAASARNTAVEFSDAQYIAVMDSDDISLPLRLEKQIAFMDKHPQIVASGTYANVINPNNTFVYRIEKATDPDTLKQNMPDMPFVHPSVIFRKKVFQQIGGYPEEFPPMEDRMLFNRMCKSGSFSNIPKVLVNYRITPTAISKSCKAFKQYLEKLVVKDFNGKKITETDLERLVEFKKRDSLTKRRCNYYILLAKKYLWNNYKPKLSRKYIKKVIFEEGRFFSFELFFLYAISFLNPKFINRLYRLVKN